MEKHRRNKTIIIITMDMFYDGAVMTEVMVIDSDSNDDNSNDMVFFTNTNLFTATLTGSPSL